MNAKTEPFPVLYAPDGYKRLSPEAKAALVNGCGPGGWLADLVPETMYGLKVTAACNIHDYMYITGETHEDKQEADRVFLNNLLRIINFYTHSKLLLWLRRRRALTYYRAVKYCGGPFFWADKNEEENLIWESTAAPNPAWQANHG